MDRLKQISSIIIVWTSLNFFFNLIIKFVLGCLLEGAFSYLDDTDTYIYLLLQTICFTLIFYLFSMKKTCYWAFSLIAILILHISFASALNIVNGKILFQSEFQFLNFKIINFFWSPFQDILNQFISVTGDFDHGFVRPENTLYAYFSWIFMPSVYFTFLSWLTKKMGSK